MITNMEELNDQLQTVHAHVAEAIDLLGLNKHGAIPDSWTLREQCHKAGQRLELFEELVAALEENLDWTECKCADMQAVGQFSVTLEVLIETTKALLAKAKTLS